MMRSLQDPIRLQSVLVSSRESFWTEQLDEEQQPLVHAFDAAFGLAVDAIFPLISKIDMPSRRPADALVPYDVAAYPIVINESIFSTSQAEFFTANAPIVQPSSTFLIGQGDGTWYVAEIPDALDPDSIDCIADHPFMPRMIMLRGVHFDRIGRHVIMAEPHWAAALPRVTLPNVSAPGHTTHVVMWALRPRIQYQRTPAGRQMAMMASQLGTAVPAEALRFLAHRSMDDARAILVAALCQAYGVDMLWNERIVRIVVDSVRPVVRIVTDVHTYEVDPAKIAHLGLSAGMRITVPTPLSDDIIVAATKQDVMQLPATLLPGLDIEWIDKAGVSRKVTLPNALHPWISAPGTSSPVRWQVVGAAADVDAYWATIATDFTPLQAAHPSGINPLHAFAILQHADMPTLVIVKRSSPSASLSPFLFLRDALSTQHLVHVHYTLAPSALTPEERAIHGLRKP